MQGSNYVCPSCFHLLRRRCYAPDGFDAVSVQNVGSTYIIVSWDLPTHSNGILINFSLYCNGALAGVLPLTVISYNTTGLLLFTLYMYITLSVGQVLQSRPQALHTSWNVVLGIISAAASLPSHTPAGTSLAKLHIPFILPPSLLPPFTFTSSLSLAPPVHCDSNLLCMRRTALLGDPLILSRH
ncbi:hypothetical protein EMCRGX_G007986 [Ephydatia muelleri]